MMLAWTGPEQFDYDGEFLKLQEVRAKPRYEALNYERRGFARRPSVRAAQL
jgi:hypothetical protein